ncbi:MAG: nickel-dependent lactate racemase [Clostridia bacterium]|nr:nickel-dependent lactate racemase [Clostridia bacterium]
MKIKLGYGTGFQSAEVPEKNILKLLEPNEISRKGSPASIVRDALANPIGTPALRDIVKPGEKIVIITSDITRPMPTWDVIPHVLDELYAADVKAEDVTLVFALGSHRAHTEEEKKKLAGERAFSEIKCVDSNPDDCIHMGNTSMGTPIDITRVVAEADRRICLGNIEYHYFAGYSGGIKALMPGASTPAAIQANHSMMVNENACAGKLDGNPLREDLEEAAELCPIDFIVNVVLDEHKQIVHAVAGDVKKAHRSGCAFLDSLYKVQIPQRADIVLVSQGGAPKDLNLYQTQKALDNSKHAVRDGGTIILVGACQEGLGQKVFEEWITEAEKPADLISRVRENFRLGGHKAAAIAMVMERADIKLVSEMDKDFVESIFFEPYSELQSAVDDALAKHGNDASIIVMPYGGSTLPVE